MLSPDKPLPVVSQGALKMREWRRRKREGAPLYQFKCVVCSATGESAHPHTRCCKPCRPAARQMSARSLTGAIAVGTELDCGHCGRRITKEHKRQFYCADCRKLSEREGLPFQIERKRAYFARYGRERRKTDPKFAMNYRMNANIKNSLKDGKNGRRWESLVGYTITDLMARLEAQFLPGMTWENRGQWHIDHIRPLCSFQFQSPDDPQFREAWALANLQPLWALDNLKKGGRWAA